MRGLTRIVSLMALFLEVGCLEAGARGFSIFSGGGGDVIVITKVTPEGHKLTPPTQEAPVYYLGRSLGCRLGSIAGDREPDEKDLTKFVAKILAKQGYVGGTKGVHEPTQFLFIQWGYMTPPNAVGYVTSQGGDSLSFLGYNAKDDIAAPTSIDMLGPEVYRRDARSRETEAILDLASADMYAVIITAFDFKTANTDRPVILWQTRMAFAANGKSMADALPTMISVAGPNIGRETKSPVLRGADDRYIGHTEPGELEVIGYEDEPDLMPTKAPVSKNK